MLTAKIFQLADVNITSALHLHCNTKTTEKQNKLKTSYLDE